MKHLISLVSAIIVAFALVASVHAQTTQQGIAAVATGPVLRCSATGAQTVTLTDAYGDYCSANATRACAFSVPGTSVVAVWEQVAGQYRLGLHEAFASNGQHAISGVPGSTCP